MTILHLSPKDPDTTTGGESVAVNDRFDALEDTDFSIENLLSNDTIEDNARITVLSMQPPLKGDQLLITETPLYLHSSR